MGSDYDTYLVRKEEVVAAEEKQQAVRDKKLAQEEVWIRKGVRAQRSRAQGRIHALLKMRAERAARRARTGNVTLRLAEADRSGVKVIDVEDMSFAYPDGKVLVRNFTTTLTRGDKIGIIGPNGSGTDAHQAPPSGNACATRARSPTARSRITRISTRCARRSTTTGRWPTTSPGEMRPSR